MRVMSVKSVNSTHSLLLATDQLSKHGAEENFYLVRSDGKGEVMTNEDAESSASQELLDTMGSTAEGGLGSVRANSVAVSPDGKLAAFYDTDGRLSILDIGKGKVKVVDTWIKEVRMKAVCDNAANGRRRHLSVSTSATPSRNSLHSSRDNDVAVEGRRRHIDLSTDTMDATLPRSPQFDELKFSPGGRYLGFSHSARNQFTQISILDVTDDEPSVVHATSDRFNCRSFIWGGKNVQP